MAAQGITNEKNANSEADDWRLDVTSEARRQFVSALKRAALVQGRLPEEVVREAVLIENDVFKRARSRAEYLKLLALAMIELRNVNHILAG